MGRKQWEKAKKIFDQCHVHVEMIETQRANHATEILRNVQIGMYDAFVTISGDGLIHEAINGVM